jgi:branched-chain amino acid transport system substrate-binding protein
VAIATAVVLSAAACGSGDTGGGHQATDGLPDKVKVASIVPITGFVAFCGVAANKGYALAIKEINEQNLLEGTKIEIEYKDTKSEPPTAAQEMTKAATDRGISAVFGSCFGNDAVAMSPIAQQKKMPIIYTQASNEGVVLGDYTYRATPLVVQLFPLLKPYIKGSGAKKLGIIYTEASPGLQELAKKTLPQMADELGVEVTATVGTQATTQDFAAPISQVLDSKPDLVAVLLFGAQSPTVMTQLRQAGYKGPVLSHSGVSGNLKPAGADGNGMVWPTDFMYQMTAASSKKFVDAYRAEYREDPLNYAAEAYDAAWFLATSMKKAQSADRESVKDAMAKVVQEPFVGALGGGLTWKDRSLLAPGGVVEQTANGEKLLYEGKSTG